MQTTSLFAGIIGAGIVVVTVEDRTTSTGSVVANVLGGTAILVIARGSIVVALASGRWFTGIRRTRIVVVAVDGIRAGAGSIPADIIHGAGVLVITGKVVCCMLTSGVWIA
jgi:hypothetical protein